MQIKLNLTKRTATALTMMVSNVAPFAKGVWSPSKMKNDKGQMRNELKRRGTCPGQLAHVTYKCRAFSR